MNKPTFNSTFIIIKLHLSAWSKQHIDINRFIQIDLANLKSINGMLIESNMKWLWLTVSLVGKKSVWNIPTKAFAEK